MGNAVERLIDLIEWADSVSQRVPLYRRIRALALDTILGPADEFEPAPPTTPPGSD